MFRTGLAAAVLAAACCLSQEARAQANDELLIKELSFEGPFEVFDVGGTRNVHGYRHGGNAEVKKNFVRLTAAREVRIRPGLSLRLANRLLNHSIKKGFCGAEMLSIQMSGLLC